MEKKIYSLKDFELSYEKSAIERAEDFQMYINQLNDFGCKSYWIASHTGIGATMNIEGYDKPIVSFIANDYLGMSQREETIQSGIEALKKYGTDILSLILIGIIKVTSTKLLPERTAPLFMFHLWVAFTIYSFCLFV